MTLPLSLYLTSTVYSLYLTLPLCLQPVSDVNSVSTVCTDVTSMSAACLWPQLCVYCLYLTSTLCLLPVSDINSVYSLYLTLPLCPQPVSDVNSVSTACICRQLCVYSLYLSPTQCLLAVCDPIMCLTFSPLSESSDSEDELCPPCLPPFFPFQPCFP